VPHPYLLAVPLRDIIPPANIAYAETLYAMAEPRKTEILTATKSIT